MKGFFIILIIPRALSIIRSSSIYRHETTCSSPLAEYRAYPNDCTKFLHCDNGRPFIKDCAPETVFNPETKVCDWPRNVPGCSGEIYTGEHINEIPGGDEYGGGGYGAGVFLPPAYNGGYGAGVDYSGQKYTGGYATRGPLLPAYNGAEYTGEYTGVDYSGKKYTGEGLLDIRY